jgi:hypothetical protein
MAKDREIPAGLPRSFRGQNQIDGNETNMLMGGQKTLNPRSMSSSPSLNSGMENSMTTQANQLHPTSK